MKLTALMAARNEDWIIGLSARVALMWNDSLVVLNHASTDRTAEILNQVAAEREGRVTILNESDPAWMEMDHRQRMLNVAREQGATHVSYVDADEVLTGNLLDEIREHIESLPPCRFLQVALPCVWPGLAQYRDDASPFGRAMTMLAFADHPSLAWKAKQDGYQFHGREPAGVRQGARFTRSSGGVMHLQFASRRRLLAKHALYKMQEVIRWPGRKPAAEIDALYSLAPSEEGAHFANVPPGWWSPYTHLLQYLDADEAPWQEAECLRLWRAHGPETFVGLNLFGVIERSEMEEQTAGREPLTGENARRWVDALIQRGVEVDEDVPEIEAGAP